MGQGFLTEDGEGQALKPLADVHVLAAFAAAPAPPTDNRTVTRAALHAAWAVSQNANSPLQLALREGRVRALRTLIEEGINVHAKEASGEWNWVHPITYFCYLITLFWGASSDRQKKVMVKWGRGSFVFSSSRARDWALGKGLGCVSVFSLAFL